MQCGFGSCDSCSDCACQQRALSGIITQNGFGFAPGNLPGSSVGGSAFSLVSGTINSVVPGASLVTSLISTVGKIIGIAPRGDLQKFQRTVYPFMRTLAAQTGLNVYIAWFNDYVVVHPDGSYGIAVPDPRPGSNVPWSELEAKIPALQGTAAYYLTGCDRSDDDCVNHPSDLRFELQDPYGTAGTAPEHTTAKTPASGPFVGPQQAGFIPSSLSGTNLLVMAGAVVALILFSGSQGRSKG